MPCHLSLVIEINFTYSSWTHSPGFIPAAPRSIGPARRQHEACAATELVERSTAMSLYSGAFLVRVETADGFTVYEKGQRDDAVPVASPKRIVISAT